MSSRACYAVMSLLVSVLWTAAAFAQERQLVATLDYEIGQAGLTAEHRAALDRVKQQYPPADFIYSFEGDHDPSPFDIITRGASKRVNERLAETRWQSAADYLGVPAIGLVHVTGSTEARVYVHRRPGTGMIPVETTDGAMGDSLAGLRREVDDLRRRLTESEETRRRTAPAETILAVARLEEIHVRGDKWVDRRWWETSGGFELGILRVSPERPEKRTGVTLAISNGTPAYHALDISTRLDFIRLGNSRIGITPALRYNDWSVRVHYGEDPHTGISYINNADPVYLLGADLDAVPWDSALLRLRYAGFGARVHAAHRPSTSYDQYDLRFDQNLWPRWRLELQGIYDERFKKGLCYYGGWIVYGFPMLLGEFAVHLGYVEQLDAFLATRAGEEDPVSTISLGFTWERQRRLKY